MILDHLQFAQRYQIIHPGLAKGFDFLRRNDLASLADGEYEIDGRRVYAIIARGSGRGREDSLLEVHDRFLDIQYVVEGTDVIGWRQREQCYRVSTPYDAERDVAFYYDRPETWLVVPQRTFTIFFPEDAHAPFAADGPIHKVVVKIEI